MTSKKTTRRALFSSVMALILCCAMLVGSTFAWFTDSVSSVNNVITAGNLDVEVYNGLTTEDPNLNTVQKLFSKVDLWEPGVVAYENLTVANVGTLALKYELAVNFDNENTVDGYGLSQILKVAVVEGGVTETGRDALVASITDWQDMASFELTGDLEDGETTTYGLVIYWEPSADDNNWNVNNGKETSDGEPLHIDLGVNLFATQLTAESDSFGPDYDAEASGLYYASYSFDSAEDLMVFDPATYNPDNTAGSGLSIVDGKAVVDAKGAFHYLDVNLNAHKYTIEYDVDVSAMTEGDVINLETGDTGTWSGTNHITIKKGSAIVSIGPAANNPTGYVDNVTMGEQLHFVHTYSMNAEGKWVTTTTVTDGTNTYTASKAVSSSAVGKIYWDVYDLGTGASGKVTLDNFTVIGNHAEIVNANQLAAALANGGEVVLSENVTLAEGEQLVIPEGVEVVLDLNGKTIAGGFQKGSDSKHVYAIENRGTLTLKNGTVSGRGVGNYGDLTVESGTYNAIDTNGGGAIWNYTGSNVTINGGTFTAANDAEAPGAVVLNVASGSTAVINGGTFVAGADQTYGIINAGTLTINNIDISADHGVISSSGTTTLNGGVYKQNGNLPQTSSLLYIAAGTTTVTGGTYNFNVEGKLDSGLPVYCAGGSVAISGGTFTGYVTDMISSWGGSGTASVTGGTFEKNPGFVADGYTATRNEDGSWTVGREYTTVSGSETNTAAQNGQALADAIEATTEAAFLKLGAGEYKMPSISGSKDVTIVGTKDTVIDVTMGAYMDSSTIAFEGVTFKVGTGYANGNGSDYAALYTPNVTYTNCTFVGPMRVGRDGAKFVNCTFTELVNDYVWTYGNDVTFEGCTFNTDGKAILIYSDGGNEISQVVVKNCTFNSTQGAKAGAIANQNCAAIEIHNYGNGVNLTTSGNTYDSNFSGEWRIKTYETGKTQIFVNGTEYTSIAIDGKTMTIDADKNVTVNG